MYVLCGLASIVAYTSLSCFVANASSSSGVRMWNAFGSAVLCFWLSGAAMKASFGTTRPYTWHNVRHDFNSVTLHGGFNSRIASVV